MPISGGDPNYAHFVNDLEQRIVDLEAKVAKLARAEAKVEKAVADIVPEKPAKDEPRPEPVRQR